MPQRKQPLSCYDTSLHCLASTIAEACAKLPLVEDEHVAAIINYVQQIPQYASNKYVDKVLKIFGGFQKSGRLGATNTDSNSPFTVALHPECAVLNLRGCQYSNSMKLAVLKNLHVMCNLEHLEITLDQFFSKEVDEEHKSAIVVFTEHISNFRKLCSLVLIHACTSEMLYNIAENCPVLKKFVADSAHLNAQDARLLVKCRSLFWLKVTSLKDPVTVTDILYLLNNLPFLEYLYISDLAAVLIELSTTDCKKSYLVKELRLCHHRNLMLPLCTHFPKLECLRLINPDGALTSLSDLKCLKSLIIRPASNVDISELEPLCSSSLIHFCLTGVQNTSLLFTKEFQLTFSTLRKLILTECEQVDVAAIDKLCPDLEKLRLSRCSASRLYVAYKPAKGPFSNLKVLEVSGDLSQEHLLHLLSSCKDLAELTLIDHEVSNERAFVMNDNLWNEILHINPLRFLKNLRIRSDDITKAIIPNILHSFNDLVSLSLEGSQWNHELSLHELEEMKGQTQIFDMTFTINEKVINV